MDAERERGEDRAGHDGVARRRGAEALCEQASGDEPEQGDIHGVDHHAGEVIAERIHAPQDVVQAPRQPRQRTPVAEERRREHPVQLRGAEAAIVDVPEEADVVVPVHELGAERRQEREEPEDRDAEGRPAREAGHGVSSAFASISR